MEVMNDQYRLGRMGNSELLAGLSALVGQSNELTAQVLAHLVELEERMLHLELGFSSLFSYCVEALGMSEGAAGRRVAAARVCRRFSGAFERVAQGQLHLCALCALAPHLTADNATELMDACRGKTRRQVEELLALRFPRPDVREQIRRLPTRTGVSVAEQALPVAQAVESFAPLSVETSGQISAQSSAISANPPSPPMGPVAAPVAQSGATAIPTSHRRAPELEPLSADRFGVHFTADAELRDQRDRRMRPIRTRIVGEEADRAARNCPERSAVCSRRTRPISGQGLLREATLFAARSRRRRAKPRALSASLRRHLKRKGGSLLSGSTPQTLPCPRTAVRDVTNHKWRLGGSNSGSVARRSEVRCDSSDAH